MIDRRERDWKRARLLRAIHRAINENDKASFVSQIRIEVGKRREYVTVLESLGVTAYAGVEAMLTKEHTAQVPRSALTGSEVVESGFAHMVADCAVRDRDSRSYVQTCALAKHQLSTSRESLRKTILEALRIVRAEGFEPNAVFIPTDFETESELVGAPSWTIPGRQNVGCYRIVPWDALKIVICPFDREFPILIASVPDFVGGVTKASHPGSISVDVIDPVQSEIAAIVETARQATMAAEIPDTDVVKVTVVAKLPPMIEVVNRAAAASVTVASAPPSCGDGSVGPS